MNINLTVQENLRKSSYTYKRTSGTVDDARKNSSNVRVFRDESTSIFTEVIINTPHLLTLFLDYTFHRLYSEVITNINSKLIDSKAFSISNNQHVHIKPLVGIERIYLIFKGGTLMKKYFDEHINDLFRIENKENFTDIDISTKYGNFFKPLNYNIDTDELVNTTHDEHMNTPNKVFKNKILKENFKISDTDYSLYINAKLHERYNVIHKFAVQLLGKAFDKMTDECDTYFEQVQNGNIFIDIAMEKFIERVPENDIYSDNTNSSRLLNDLRHFLDSNQHIVNIINNMEFGLFIFIERIRDFLENIHFQFNNIYESYNQSQIIVLLKYIQKLNVDFGEMIGPIRCRLLPIQENIILNEDNYDAILINIQQCINILIEKKFYLLKKNNFYTKEKFVSIRTQLKEWYLNIGQNNPEEVNPQQIDPILDTKYERGYDPTYIKDKYDRYNLQYDRIHNPEITNDDFEFSKKKSSIILSKNNPIDLNDSILIENLKNHYISFNETIRKTRANGEFTADFDLMRSKFNITINKPDVLTKNGEPHIASIPSEFIDVSIPRFEETARIEFFNHIINHNNNLPTYLRFDNNPGVSISAYSNSEVLDDLLYTLFNQNSFEPWLDKKYTKRIIRVVTLIIIDFLHNLSLNPGLDRNNEIKMIRMFFELCYAIEQYVMIDGSNYPFHIVAQFLEGYNHNNINDQKNIKLINYLKTVKTFINEWIKEQNNKLNFFIHHSFKSLEKIIFNIILWSFMYKMPDDDLVITLNDISKHYLQAQIYNINNTDPNNNHRDLNTLNIYYAKNNFTKMLKIIYDYGFKLLYVIDDNIPNHINIIPPPVPALVGPQDGGKKNYYNKYIKYKTKYLKK